MLLHICANLWVKILKFGGSKNFTTFWHLKNPKKSALFSPANAQLVTYSKIQTKVSRVPWGPPMDWFLIKSVNVEYPLSCCKCVEKWTFCVLCPAGSPKCVTPPKNSTTIYLGICPPTTWKTLWCPIAPSLRKKIDFLKASFFGKLLKWPWSHQKLTYIKNDQGGS